MHATPYVAARGLARKEAGWEWWRIRWNELKHFRQQYAATLDVLAANLHNMVSTGGASAAGDRPLLTPVALQQCGIGKSWLGSRCIELLQQPRDAPDVEAAMAEQLKQSWACRSGIFHPSAVDRALAEPTGSSSDTLLLRSLRHMYPEHADVVDKLKDANTLFLRLSLLYRGRSADEALAFAIYAAGSVDPSEGDAAFEVFQMQPDVARTAAGAAQAHIEANGGAPLMILLDPLTEATALCGTVMPGINRQAKLLAGLAALSPVMRALHGVRGCFVYSNASGMRWEDTQPLLRPSPGPPRMSLAPILMPAMTSADVRAMMEKHDSKDGRQIATLMGISPQLVPRFAAAVSLAELAGRVSSSHSR